MPRRVSFSILPALAALVLAPAAVAASPLTWVRGIPIPTSGAELTAPFGVVEFPAGAVDRVRYPAQRLLITPDGIWVLPARGSSAAPVLLWSYPPTLVPSATLSQAAGFIRPDGTRDLVMSAKPRDLEQFSVETGTILHDVPAPGLIPGAQSIVVDPGGDGFILKDDQIYAIDIDTAGTVPSPLLTAGTGGGAGQLSGSTSMAIGPDDLLYVLDAGNQRMEAFTRSGAYVRQFPMATGDTIPGYLFTVGRDLRFDINNGLTGGAVYDFAGTFLGTFATPEEDSGLRPSSRPLIAAQEPDGTVLFATDSGLDVHEFVPTYSMPELIDDVRASGLPRGVTTALVAQLDAAQRSLDHRDRFTARLVLALFTLEVSVLDGHSQVAPGILPGLLIVARGLFGALAN